MKKLVCFGMNFGSDLWSYGGVLIDASVQTLHDGDRDISVELIDGDKTQICRIYDRLETRLDGYGNGYEKKKGQVFNIAVASHQVFARHHT